MKKVGLITIHKVFNCGSSLQALATKKTVENLGFECSVIDYAYPNHYHKRVSKGLSPYYPNKFTFMERVRMHFFHKWTNHYQQKRDKLKNFNERYLSLTCPYPDRESLFNNKPDFDVYITGSDQVWNPRYLYEDTTFYLPFISNKPKIAFSASFGVTSLTEEYSQIIRPLLQQYDYISTRELSGVEIINKIVGRNAICTCDPTLLLNLTEWLEYTNKDPLIKGKYILCYILTYTSDPYPYILNLIKQIKRLTGYKIVIIDDNGRYWFRQGYKGMHSVGPEDFINLFAYASFVITTSFHGTAFALNFNKDFYSVVSPSSNDERQSSLLKNVGAFDRLVKYGDPLPLKDTIFIKNWDSINREIEVIRHYSLDYIEAALNNVLK